MGISIISTTIVLGLLKFVAVAAAAVITAALLWLAGLYLLASIGNLIKELNHEHIGIKSSRNLEQEITREAARRRVYKWMFIKGVQMVGLIFLTFTAAFLWSLV